MKWPWSDSLARRIRWGYYVLIAVAGLTMVLMGASMTHVRRQVYSLETTAGLLDAVLEVRRYEKNWLLYAQGEDFLANQEQLGRARELLTAWSGLGGEDATGLSRQLEQLLASYGELMAAAVRAAGNKRQQELEADIRHSGKRMVTLAENIDRGVRQAIDQTLKRISNSGVVLALLVSGLALLLGRQMATSVVGPLKRISDYTREIAAGRFAARGAGDSAVEIDAILKAIQVMLDVLERREKQIIKSEKLAAVGTLVAGVAHELNNPLSNAGTSAQIILEELESGSAVDPAFLLEMTRQIVDQTERARITVRSLLEFSREKEVRPREIELAPFLEETVALVRGEVPSRVTLTTEITGNGHFFADKQRLQQAVVNLLMNAIHAVAGEGEIVLRGGIDTTDRMEEVSRTPGTAPERPVGGTVTLQVSDNGQGISAADIGRIFDPFFTTKDVGEGSGLGLAVTREIVNKHGGDIVVESREGAGAVFTITLPLRNVEDTEKS